MITVSPFFESESPESLLRPGIHPFPDLLQMTPQEILSRFRESQKEDFLKVIDSPELQDPILLYGESTPGGGGTPDSVLPDRETLRSLFLDMHDHVMEHPVWIHPFFVRFFQGNFTLEQLKTFALQYFNQIKNTRQCVAMAIGRFNGFSRKEHGPYSERIGELTQIVLAQLVADEYGVSTHSVEDYPTLGGVFRSTTHIVMYRKLFEGLSIPFEMQDIPMISGVADNVAVQRILAGSEVFDELEALASVGLGMEWGVPEFFSLLLGGFLRFAREKNVPLTPDHLLVFIAHVRYDVMHAIAVMYVTALHMKGEEDLDKVKFATNTLMASRYHMMDDLYREVFQEEPPPQKLNRRYHINDGRIREKLRHARLRAADGSVKDIEKYRRLSTDPFPKS